jgi:hypothetical protein
MGGNTDEDGSPLASRKGRESENRQQLDGVPDV